MFVGLVGGFPDSEQVRYICFYFPEVLRSPQSPQAWRDKPPASVLRAGSGGVPFLTDSW